MTSHQQHLAHHRHQGLAPFKTASHQPVVVGGKGRVGQGERTQRGHIEEHAAHPPAAAFGELDLPFPLAALAHFEVQAHVGHRLVDAAKARHVAQLGTQHGNSLAPEFGDAAQTAGPFITAEHAIQFLL